MALAGLYWISLDSSPFLLRGARQIVRFLTSWRKSGEEEALAVWLSRWIAKKTRKTSPLTSWDIRLLFAIDKLVAAIFRDASRERTTFKYDPVINYFSFGKIPLRKCLEINLRLMWMCAKISRLPQLSQPQYPSYANITAKHFQNPEW